MIFVKDCGLFLHLAQELEAARGLAVFIAVCPQEQPVCPCTEQGWDRDARLCAAGKEKLLCVAVPAMMPLEAACSDTSGLQRSERSAVGRVGEVREASKGENGVNGSPQGLEPQKSCGKAFLVKLTCIFLW